MSSNKLAHFATTALEVTKMVLIIAAHTTCKMVSVGKSEAIKQYKLYYENATPQQLAALRAFKELTEKGAHAAKQEMKAVTGKVQAAKENIKPAEKKK